MGAHSRARRQPRGIMRGLRAPTAGRWTSSRARSPRLSLYHPPLLALPLEADEPGAVGKDNAGGGLGALDAKLGDLVLAAGRGMALDPVGDGLVHLDLGG